MCGHGWRQRVGIDFRQEGVTEVMRRERLQEIQRLLEVRRETDNRFSDSEKTSVVAELLDEVANAAECFTPTTASTD